MKKKRPKVSSSPPHNSLVGQWLIDRRIKVKASSFFLVSIWPIRLYFILQLSIDQTILKKTPSLFELNNLIAHEKDLLIYMEHFLFLFVYRNSVLLKIKFVCVCVMSLFVQRILDKLEQERYVVMNKYEQRRRKKKREFVVLLITVLFLEPKVHCLLVANI